MCVVDCTYNTLYIHGRFGIVECKGALLQTRCMQCVYKGPMGEECLVWASVVQTREGSDC